MELVAGYLDLGRQIFRQTHGIHIRRHGSGHNGNYNMHNRNSQVDKKKLFLGIVGLLGGIICILVPSSTLQDRSLISYVLLGISLVIFGSIDIWEAIEGLRKRRKEKYKAKDTKGQDIFN